MSANRKIGRRRFVRSLAGWCVIVICGPGSLWESFDPHRGWHASLHRLLRRLNHRESAAAVGREYLRTSGGNADPEGMIRRLVSGSVLEAAGTGGIDPYTLLSMLQRRVRRDFEQGRTVEVGGWILSLTEVRLCVLAALSGPGQVSRRLSGRRWRGVD